MIYKEQFQQMQGRVIENNQVVGYRFFYAPIQANVPVELGNPSSFNDFGKVPCLGTLCLIVIVSIMKVL